MGHDFPFRLLALSQYLLLHSDTYVCVAEQQKKEKISPSVYVFSFLEGKDSP